jgi:GcrA cell cycle regulator
MQRTWTNERIAEMIKLNDGRSATEIARAMGDCSRSAVMAKLGRMGILLKSAVPRNNSASRAKKIMADRARQTAQRAKRARQAAQCAKRARQAAQCVVKVAATPPVVVLAPPVPPRDPLPGTTPVAFSDLSAESCRWPFGDGSKPYTYCGCAKTDGLAYCASHAAIAFEAPTPRRRPEQYITTVPAFGVTAAKAAQEFLKETV